MTRHPPHALILSALAIVAATGAVVVVAAVSGVSIDRIFEDFRPWWIVPLAIVAAIVGLLALNSNTTTWCRAPPATLSMAST